MSVFHTIRRARPLLIQFQGDSLVALNYLSKQSCAIEPLGSALLAALQDWQDVEHALARFASSSRANVLHEIDRLLAASMIVERNTPAGTQDETFEREFVWGAAAGYYHFAIRNTEYMAPGQFAGWMTEHVASAPPIPVHLDHKQSRNAIRLPCPATDLEGMALMRRRRSFRGFTDQPIEIGQLGDCLFAGLGITGFVKGSFDEGYPHVPIILQDNADRLAAFKLARNEAKRTGLDLDPAYGSGAGIAGHAGDQARRPSRTR
jgi:hypothetical protein